MRYLSADCIIPVEGEPVYDHVLAVADDGTIEGIFSTGELSNSHCEIQRFKGILCPGFVNTHCHLELSWAKGLISEGRSLDYFLRELETLRVSVSETDRKNAIEKAASDMLQAGIVATADISNGNYTLDYKNKSHHYFHTMVEVFGSNPANAEAIFEKASKLKAEFELQSLFGKASIVPHATYSLSEELFRMVTNSDSRLSSIHHQENEDENSFFKDGTGPIAERRKIFNPDLPEFTGTAKRPMESIAKYLNKNQKLLLVHNTVSEQQDIDFVKNYFSDATWCLCPNANLYIEKKLPDISLLRKNNCRISIGTDSLASNHHLSILEEIKTIQHFFQAIPLQELIKWGTLHGAILLDMEQKLGSFVKGKQPGVVLVENANLSTLKLNPDSTSRLLIPASYESNS